MVIAGPGIPKSKIKKMIVKILYGLASTTAPRYPSDGRACALLAEVVVVIIDKERVVSLAVFGGNENQNWARTLFMSEPRPIRRLHEELINKIAAGEVCISKYIY